jgi:uncharacterized membrane protein YvlD (DUF360 family)
VTFGLFIFVINALLFALAAWLAPGFTVHGFRAALVGSILYPELCIDDLFHGRGASWSASGMGLIRHTGE